MLQETRGIVLKHIKFGDKSIVTTIYTEQEGRKSFLVKNVYSNRSGFILLFSNHLLF